MRIHNAKKLFSYQDLRDSTECSFAVDLDLCDLTEPIERKKDSEWLHILFRKGNEFEKDYLASLSQGAVPASSGLWGTTILATAAFFGHREKTSLTTLEFSGHRARVS